MKPTETVRHPLTAPTFRTLWSANVVANVGVWMQTVGGAWLMTTLTTDALPVALMQTATTLPAFLIGLPAGSLADRIDHRRLLLITNAWMLASVMLLALLTLFGLVNPWLLLACTFSLGIGSTLNAPTWSAMLPDVVSRAQVPTAIIMNSAGFNIARAVGPAIGGFVVAAFGPAGTFLLNALSFCATIGAVFRWRPRASPENPDGNSGPGPSLSKEVRPTASSAENRLVGRTSGIYRRLSEGPPEAFMRTIAIGLEYVWRSYTQRIVLVRSVIWMLCASALWGLLPLVARRELALDANGYGLLVSCVGAGAVIGSFFLPEIRRHQPTNRLLIAAVLSFAAMLLTLAWVRWLPLVCVMLGLGGFAWTSSNQNFQIAVQMSAPGWVRARAIAAYLLTFQGGLAVGSAIWGVVAERSDDVVALTIAALGLLVGLVAAVRWPVEDAK